MPASKSQQRAVAKYMKNNYDEIKMRVPKGHKAEIEAHAQSMGESLNGFMNRAADETMERDGEPQSTQSQPQGGAQPSDRPEAIAESGTEK